MRHRVYGKHLSRDKNERTALFRSLVGSLILHGSIETTEAKAKAIKGLVDKIINLAKSKNSKYIVQTYLTSKPLQDRVINEIAPKFSDRQSGYTSLVKLGTQQGDRTMVVKMSLIGLEELKEIKKEPKIKTQEVSSKTEKAAKSPVKKEETKDTKKEPAKKGVKKANP